MKILHTSDWHIGKKLYGKERLDEQRAVLFEIAEISEQNDVDVVLAAGDIFDAYTPSNESEEIFYESILKIANDKRLVLIIAGNHDDPVRLSAACDLARKHGIIIVKNINYKPQKIKTKLAEVIKSECGGIVVRNSSGESCAIAFLPYPGSGEILGEAEETYSQKVSNLVNDKIFAKDTFNIVLSHFFTLGASPASDERNIELSGTRIVDVSVFSGLINYIMLGHIHKMQNLSKDKNVCYCGSILQNTFDEGCVKGVKIIEIKNNVLVSDDFIKLKNCKKLVKITAKSIEEAGGVLAEHSDNYVELTLEINEPLGFTENRDLRKNYPNLVNIILNIHSGEKKEHKSVRHLNSKDLFIEFWKEKYGAEAPIDILELYLKLTGENIETKELSC
ncbi:MAG: exonuclease subunit SbcD [Firmicutes bacterium]|nr:exonuclease subunit SbcD [Bacillota bacterium]